MILELPLLLFRPLSYIRWLIKSNIYTNYASYHASDPAIESAKFPGIGSCCCPYLYSSSIHAPALQCPAFSISAVWPRPRKRSITQIDQPDDTLVRSSSARVRKAKRTKIQTQNRSLPLRHPRQIPLRPQNRRNALFDSF